MKYLTSLFLGCLLGLGTPSNAVAEVTAEGWAEHRAVPAGIYYPGDTVEAWAYANGRVHIQAFGRNDTWNYWNCVGAYASDGIGEVPGPYPYQVLVNGEGPVRLYCDIHEIYTDSTTLGWEHLGEHKSVAYSEVHVSVRVNGDGPADVDYPLRKEETTYEVRAIEPPGGDEELPIVVGPDEIS